MTNQVETFAAQFEAANDDLIAAVAGCADADWGRRCANEERTVGAVARHVADVYPAFAGIVATFAAGRTFSPAPSQADVDRENAATVAEATPGREETLAALRANGAALADQLRRLSDDQLDRVAGTFGGNELRVAQVLEWVVIGHTLEHLATVRGTIQS